MTPMSAEMTLAIQSELDCRIAEGEQHHQLHISRARYESDAARRRFMLVDPAYRFDDAHVLVLDPLAAGGSNQAQLLSRRTILERGRPETIPRLVADLVKTPPNVIIGDGVLIVRTLRNLTTTVPIVAILGAGLLAGGLAVSLSSPGGNITGVTTLGTDLHAKRIELLKEAIPTYLCTRQARYLSRARLHHRRGLVLRPRRSRRASSSSSTWGPRRSA
jgi:hypothetical protein